jgi:Trp operon repressor
VPVSEQQATYDYQRYRQLLSEAVDETSRLRLITLLITERARDRLEAQRASDRDAMTAETVARVLGNGRREPFQRG